MSRFRLSFGCLLTALVALGVLGQLSPIGGSSGPAAIVLLAVIGTMAAIVVVLRAAARLPQALLGGAAVAAYVIVRANPFVNDQVWSGWDPAFGLLELWLSVVAVLAARNVALNLVEFEDAVANITFGDLARVKSLDSAASEIAVEMSRARRHERPLTVTVLSAEESAVHGSLHRVVQEVQQGMMQRYIMSGLARLAAQTTRRGDIVVQDAANNRVIILSPEASPQQVEHLAGRLQFIAADRLGLPVRYGSAGFPVQALTFDDLVAQATLLAGQELPEDAIPEDEIALRRRRQSWNTGADPQVVLPVDGAGNVDSEPVLGKVVGGS